MREQSTHNKVNDVAEEPMAEHCLETLAELKRSHREIRQLLQIITQHTPCGIILTNMLAECYYVNSRWTEITGFSFRQSEGNNWMNVIHPKDRKIVSRQWFGSSSIGTQFTLEFRLVTNDGKTIWVEGGLKPLTNVDGQTTGYFCTIVDITLRKQAEKEHLVLRTQFLEAQKMESLGTLAGGIAHDFNNILGIIIGYTSLLLASNHLKDKKEQYLNMVIKAAERGGNLVQQILTFARRKELVFASFDINLMVKELKRMLSETFPKTIPINLQLGKNMPLIWGDVSQIHQAILNVCVNARDAMPTGGTITILTDVVSGSSIRENHPKAIEDRYLLVQISDTGEGMDESTLLRIFEPFFTTKKQGKGTGLGLAMVYGVVETHKGIIDVASERTKGSTFSLYFPVSSDLEEKGTPDQQKAEELPGGSETILVIEDEPAIQELLSELLQAKGYNVHIARDGREGIDMYVKYQQSIDLVLCDLDLPHVRGVNVLQYLWTLNPKMKAILMSGYINPQLRSELSTYSACMLIEKPLRFSTLLPALRQMLDMQVKKPDSNPHSSIDQLDNSA